MCEFLRRADVVARTDGGTNTAKSGNLFMLKDSKANLLRQLNKELQAEGLGNCSAELFLCAGLSQVSRVHIPKQKKQSQLQPHSVFIVRLLP